jgi:hypothetical protein
VQHQLDNKQPLDADLTTIAAFAPATFGTETSVVNGTTITHDHVADFIVGSTSFTGTQWQMKRGAEIRDHLGLGDIAIMDTKQFVRADQESLSSNIAKDLNINGYKLTSVAPGISGTDAVNVNQLEALVTGLSWKQAVVAMSTTNEVFTGGVFTPAANTFDGYDTTNGGAAVLTGTRILLAKQTLAKENGIYVFDGTAWARAKDLDVGAEANGAAVFVEFGNTQKTTGWTVTSKVAVIGVDAVTWTQFNGASGLTAGIGLTIDGNTINVGLGAGIVELPTDEIGLDLYSDSSAIILTSDGSTRSAATNARLHLLLDTIVTSGQLSQSVNGLKIADGTITPTQLNTSVAGAGLTFSTADAIAVVSATGTASIGADDVTKWTGVGTVTVTADAVGVTLGSTSTTAAPGNHTHKSDVITYDPTTSTLAATNVKSALDEVVSKLNTVKDDLLKEINEIEAATGLEIDGKYVADATTNYLKLVTTLKAADKELDNQIKLINNKISKSFYVYDGTTAASQSHTFTHDIGQQFCNVTVIDMTNPLLPEAVIPGHIYFDSTTAMTVTFNQAIKCKIAVQGMVM